MLGLTLVSIGVRCSPTITTTVHLRAGEDRLLQAEFEPTMSCMRPSPIVVSPAVILLENWPEFRGVGIAELHDGGNDVSSLGLDIGPHIRVTYARKSCSRESKLSSCMNATDATSIGTANRAATRNILNAFILLYLSRFSRVEQPSSLLDTGHRPLICMDCT